MSDQSIQSMQAPLASRVKLPRRYAAALPTDSESITIRTSVRALQGMQKEALLRYGPTGTVWRLFCDEGPYLNGTDLAPYPLAFFTAGLAADTLSELHALAAEQALDLAGLDLVQDDRYSMQGSALRGTMQAGAAPQQVYFGGVHASAEPSRLNELLHQALTASPGNALLRMPLTNTFSLTHNGAALEVAHLPPSSATPPPDPGEGFEQAFAIEPCADNLIEKISSGESIFGVEGGVGTSLAPEQKRPVHLRGISPLNQQSRSTIDVRLMHPIGSDFRFLSDRCPGPGGQETAPTGLALLSAGIAFCFMTQLGRYAQIVKQHLGAYRVVQDTVFSLPGSISRGASKICAQPVDTHVFIDSDGGDDAAQQLLKMGAQTCFVHAACRSANKTRVKPFISKVHT